MKHDRVCRVLSISAAAAPVAQTQTIQTPTVDAATAPLKSAVDEHREARGCPEAQDPHYLHPLSLIAFLTP
jgi:hypothetical protein